MFDQLEKLLLKGDYFGASSILRRLGRLFRLTPVNDQPGGFQGAAVQIVPTDNCLHIFLAFNDKEDFLACPGDLVQLDDRDSLRLYSKGIQLGELSKPEYSRGVLLHFLHTEVNNDTIH